jgi:hypothetical protein
MREKNLHSEGSDRNEEKTRRVYRSPSTGALGKGESPEIYEYKNHQI